MTEYILKRDGVAVGSVDVTNRGVLIDENFARLMEESGLDLVPTGFEREQDGTKLRFSAEAPAEAMVEMLVLLKNYLHIQGYELLTC